MRFLHLVAVAFFLGGQLMLATAVLPAVRRHRADAAMRSVARRFGVGSIVALVVLIATGVAMASRGDQWRDDVLQLKLMVLVVVIVLVALHRLSPTSRAIWGAVFLSSLALVWLGVQLAHGG